MPRKLTVREKTRNRLGLETWAHRLSEEVKAAPVIRKPRIVDSDLCNIVPIGDPHFGMYSWGDESGHDFDLKIASRQHLSAVSAIFSRVPAARSCVIIILGDFFHSDGHTATTTAGTPVDVDTRWRRVLGVGLDAVVKTIKTALVKHERVTVRIVQGNHDTRSSDFLALALAAHFRSNRRCKIDLSPAPRWYYRFGKTLVGATHGHQCRPKNLPAAMASERARDWGETEFRYFYFGHVHHKTVLEHPGCVTESFRTLAPRDAWHAGQGYSAGRDMQAIVLHRNFGEVERHTVPVQMIKGR